MLAWRKQEELVIWSDMERVVMVASGRHGGQESLCR